MGSKYLAAVEKWTLTLAAGLIAVAWVVLARKTALSVSLGAGLMAVNAYVIRRIGDRAGMADRPRSGLFLFNIKMAVLAGAVFLCIRYLHIEPVAFIIGLSVFPVAFVIVAIRHALSPLDEGASESAQEDTHG